MPNVPLEAVPDQWHRYFAVECNNRAWTLAVSERSAAEDREMLDVAHASAFHWRHAGSELNRMRATMLLAAVHAQLGYGASALAYADEMRSYFLAQDTPDWEIAFTHAIYAHAACAAGNSTAHRAAYAAAVQALAAIDDPGDKQVVQQTFDLVPIPDDESL